METWAGRKKYSDSCSSSLLGSSHSFGESSGAAGKRSARLDERALAVSLVSSIGIVYHSLLRPTMSSQRKFSTVAPRSQHKPHPLRFGITAVKSSLGRYARVAMSVTRCFVPEVGRWYRKLSLYRIFSR